jgi:hypothetical protein
MYIFGYGAVDVMGVGECCVFVLSLVVVGVGRRAVAEWCDMYIIEIY